MFVAILISSVGALITFLAIYILKKNKSSPPNHYLNKLPGLPPNPIFGNTLEVLGKDSTCFLQLLWNWSFKYGNMFKLHDGPFSSIVASADEGFMEYVLSSTKLIDKSPQYNFFHNWLGTGLLTASAEKHRVRRKLLTPAFHFSILDNFVDVFDSSSNIFVKVLEKYVDQPSFDIYPLVTMCTLDIICETAMGVKINAQINPDSKYVKSVKTMCEIILTRSFSALSPAFYPFTLNYYREKLALRHLHGHTNRIIDERLREVKSSKLENDKNEYGVKRKLAFLDLLIQTSNNGNLLSRDDIREEVDTFMFEGHDTTSSALSFCLYELSINPKVQEKALAELKGIFHDRDIKTASASMADLQSMKYLELVIKETLRLYPSVPLFARIVREDFEYDGIFYPKGTPLLLMPIATQRNPDYFSDPLEFKPERFLEQTNRNPYVYVPFSAGSRNCIGQKFAMLELKSTISKLLRHYELLPATPEHYLALAPEIILVSKNGVRLSLKKRVYN